MDGACFVAQEEVAQLLGVSDWTMRRWVERYEDGGVIALVEKPLGRTPANAAPVNEVFDLVMNYQARHEGWSVRHYYDHYRDAGGTRSHNWVRIHLQAAGAAPKGRTGCIGNQPSCRAWCCTRTPAGGALGLGGGDGRRQLARQGVADSQECEQPIHLFSPTEIRRTAHANAVRPVHPKAGILGATPRREIQAQAAKMHSNARGEERPSDPIGQRAIWATRTSGAECAYFHQQATEFENLPFDLDFRTCSKPRTSPNCGDFDVVTRVEGSYVSGSVSKRLASDVNASGVDGFSYGQQQQLEDLRVTPRLWVATKTIHVPCADVVSEAPQGALMAAPAKPC